MNILKPVLASILVSLFSSTVFADTQIFSRDRHGNASTFSLKDNSARLDDNQQPGHIIIDLEKNRVAMVDPQRRQVMEMGNIPPLQQPGATSKLDIKLVDKGTGPKIAGYKTRKYDIQVNGRHCGTVFGSRDAMKVKGVETLMDAMGMMQQQSSSMSGGFYSMMGRQMDECQQADLEMNQHLKTSGIPMKILDQRGLVESEITAIKQGVKLPPNHYSYPANYQVTDMQQQMQQVQQQSQQMMQQMPDMDQIMQQMQQHTQDMPPEAPQRLQKMQEMFKQQFQQQ